MVERALMIVGDNYHSYSVESHGSKNHADCGEAAVNSLAIV
jgi:hypothetical protein